MKTRRGNGLNRPVGRKASLSWLNEKEIFVMYFCLKAKEMKTVGRRLAASEKEIVVIYAAHLLNELSFFPSENRLAGYTGTDFLRKFAPG